jgi:hypothetical protein
MRGDMQTQIVALYLMTSPHANMIGVFHCPLIYISHDTGSPLEGASEGLKKLIESGFCTFDEESEMIWVHEMAKYQIGEELKDSDNRVKDIQKQYINLPEGIIKQGFYDKYHASYHLPHSCSHISPSEAPPKPLRSQKQKQEQEIKPLSLVPIDVSDSRLVFDYWRTEMNHDKAAFDPKRQKLIKNALDLGYSIADLRSAIDGCKLSPYHQGQNENKSKYDGLDLILRDAGKIDKFMAIAREKTQFQQRRFVPA